MYYTSRLYTVIADMFDTEVAMRLSDIKDPPWTSGTLQSHSLMPLHDSVRQLGGRQIIIPLFNNLRWEFYNKFAT